MSMNKDLPVFWFTGLSGSGKTTYSKYLKNFLLANNIASAILDGDEIRNGLSDDLGFSDLDRVENNRRVIEIAKILQKNNIIPIVSMITPFEFIREDARNKLQNLNLIFISASIDTCKNRDIKNLYQKAFNEEIENFTGITSKFEKPKKYQLCIDTEKNDIKMCCKILYDFVKKIILNEK